MNICFIPPLQHMAAVRIALCIFHDKDIEKMLEIVGEIPLGNSYFPRDRFEYWKLIETKAAEKLPLLPDSLKTRVSKFIRPIHQQNLLWRHEHDYLENDYLAENCGPLDYKNIFCWKTDGTIDRTQTAKKFVQSKSIDPETRFTMACTYFLEEEVLALWYGDEVLNFKSFRFEYRRNAAVRFWVRRLKKRSWRKTPWKAGIDGYFKNLRVPQYDSRLRVSCFFPYLSWEGKKNYLDYIRWSTGHRDDLRLCLREMNEGEFVETVSVYPANILGCVMLWPFQSLFIDMAKLLWSHMNFDQFEVIFNHIIFDKILQGLDDFDYIGLLKEFWHLSPASYKRKMKKHKKMFKSIEATLNYDEKNASMSLPETIAELMDERTSKVSILSNV